jgi:DnaJ-class molecular chaperone
MIGGLLVYGRPVLAAFGLWRQWQSIKGNKAQQKKPDSGPMDLSMARQILGVEEGASKEDILAAHRALMAKNHPDKGGSTYLASQINQAKDLLLADLEK